MGSLLIEILDEWVRKMWAQCFVQMFDGARSWVGAPPGMCIFAETCGDAVALEHNTATSIRAITSSMPEYLLGNIREQTLVQLVGLNKQRKFGRDKRDTLRAMP